MNPALRALALSLAEAGDRGWDVHRVRDHLIEKALFREQRDLVVDLVLAAHGLLVGAEVDQAGLIEIWGAARLDATAAVTSHQVRLLTWPS